MHRRCRTLAHAYWYPAADCYADHHAHTYCHTNSIRHAQAKHITVHLEFTEKQFRLTVRDDGRGFDTTTPRESKGGFGLVGMRERAKELQGSFEAHSSPGAGTEVALTIPLGTQ